jgi:hypothetical protein
LFAGGGQGRRSSGLVREFVTPHRKTSSVRESAGPVLPTVVQTLQDYPPEKGLKELNAARLALALRNWRMFRAKNQCDVQLVSILSHGVRNQLAASKELYLDLELREEDRFLLRSSLRDPEKFFDIPDDILLLMLKAVVAPTDTAEFLSQLETMVQEFSKAGRIKDDKLSIENAKEIRSNFTTFNEEFTHCYNFLMDTLLPKYRESPLHVPSFWMKNADRPMEVPTCVYAIYIKYCPSRLYVLRHRSAVQGLLRDSVSDRESTLQKFISNMDVCINRTYSCYANSKTEVELFKAPVDNNLLGSSHFSGGGKMGSTGRLAFQRQSLSKADERLLVLYDKAVNNDKVSKLKKQYDSKQYPCNKYIENSCTEGDKCKFSHEHWFCEFVTLLRLKKSAAKFFPELLPLLNSAKCAKILENRKRLTSASPFFMLQQVDLDGSDASSSDEDEEMVSESTEAGAAMDYESSSASSFVADEHHE